MPNTRQHCFEECTFVIFGATGDLSKRKLIPAIYKLVEDNKLCKFSIIGASLKSVSIDQLLADSQQFIPNFNDEIWTKIASVFSYCQMDFHDNTSYHKLHDLILKIETENRLPGNRIFYFATMPEHFMVITKNLVKHDIVKKHSHTPTHNKAPWYRVVYEKPFGYDLASSQKINRYLAKIFDESQIFRIDHYLGKELVGNIALTRFTNGVFEPLWNNKYIDAVQIIVSEKIGIEGRGAYYDRYGTTKDMVQSHLLQLLALTTMESPQELSAQYIRDTKARLLKKVTVDNVIFGQYEGYQQENDVKPDSKTETFVALQLSINNKRWKGVPFYLKTGKGLDKKDSSIHIKFKMVKCLLTACPTDSNYLTIRIHPNEGIYLELNSKVPGVPDQVTPITMEFCHSVLFGPNTPEAYEVLLADVIKGDQSAFIRADEVTLSWKIVEQIEKIKGLVYHYAQGSSGPQELELLDKKRKVQWRG